MEKWIVLNQQTAGRDKLARLLQYLSRAVWHSLETADFSPILVENFRTLEYVMSTFRKLLRFGRCLDVFYGSLKSIHHHDYTLRITLTLSKLCQALYLFADHFLWLARAGLLSEINLRKWTRHANKYWLLSVIMNLCRDFYEIMNLWDLHRTACHSDLRAQPSPVVSIRSPRDFARLALHSYSLMLDHKDVLVDTVKNTCDLFIPLTALGFTNLTPRTIGMLGAISSVAGIMALVTPSAKLLPA